MTTLDLSGTLPPAPRGLNIKWSIIVPWVVTALVFGAQGYHRFLSVEAAHDADASQVRALVLKVDALEREMAVQRAVLDRVEAALNDDRRRRSRP